MYVLASVKRLYYIGPERYFHRGLWQMAFFNRLVKRNITKEKEVSNGLD